MNINGLWKHVKGKANVVGYSKKLRPRIKNGENTDELCFRVYVTTKLPLSSLKIEDVIPAKIEDIPTDIIKIGEMKALSNTARVRPLVAGVSIGNWSITAGTLGWFFKDGRGREMIGSNAHVLAENALKLGSQETRIVQPGRYDNGTLNDIVAEYFWHKPLGNESDCALSTNLVFSLNKISSVLGRKTRFPVPIVNETHHIDFALARPTVDFNLLMKDLNSFNGFIGLGFAGSSQASFFCKAKYIESEGWTPIDKEVATVSINDTIHKVGRTTEYTNGRVIDDSVHGRVKYSDQDTVEFDDLILTEAMLQGGDSGDSAWLHVIT